MVCGPPHAPRTIRPCSFGWLLFSIIRVPRFVRGDESIGRRGGDAEAVRDFSHADVRIGQHRLGGLNVVLRQFRERPSPAGDLRADQNVHRLPPSVARSTGVVRRRFAQKPRRPPDPTAEPQPRATPLASTLNLDTSIPLRLEKVRAEFSLTALALQSAARSQNRGVPRFDCPRYRLESMLETVLLLKSATLGLYCTGPEIRFIIARKDLHRGGDANGSSDRRDRTVG
jgi:hypothetical protein